MSGRIVVHGEDTADALYKQSDFLIKSADARLVKFFGSRSLVT